MDRGSIPRCSTRRCSGATCRSASSSTATRSASGLSLTPVFQFRRQCPWLVTDQDRRGLDLSVGVRNILDAKNDFLHPYPGHPPLPGASREVMLSLSWQSPAP